MWENVIKARYLGDDRRDRRRKLIIPVTNEECPYAAEVELIKIVLNVEIEYEPPVSVWSSIFKYINTTAESKA